MGPHLPPAWTPSGAPAPAQRPDTARAQTPYPSDRTGPPRSSPHTITHRQIECLSQADSTDKERREREERERERREERVREFAHVRSR